MTSPLLTRNEAIAYLRLDALGVRNPGLTLDHYRRAGILKGVKISKHVLFLQSDLDRFIKEQQERIPV